MLSQRGAKVPRNNSYCMEHVPGSQRKFQPAPVPFNSHSTQPKKPPALSPCMAAVQCRKFHYSGHFQNPMALHYVNGCGGRGTKIPQLSFRIMDYFWRVGFGVSLSCTRPPRPPQGPVCRSGSRRRPPPPGTLYYAISAMSGAYFPIYVCRSAAICRGAFSCLQNSLELLRNGWG